LAQPKPTGAKLGRLALIKLGRTRARSPHGPNLEPSFGSNPYGVKMGEVTGPTRNHQTPAFTGICHVASPFGPTPCEAVAKGDKLRHVRTDLGFRVHHMAAIWGPSGSLWTQLKIWVPVGSMVGQVGPSWAPLWAAFGPSPSQFCRFNATR
jgi:hypothetical protein